VSARAPTLLSALLRLRDPVADGHRRLQHAGLVHQTEMLAGVPISTFTGCYEASDLTLPD
jgi:hypothetical protein